MWDSINVDVEFRDRLVTMSLPPCIRHEIIMDLMEYITPPMGLFVPLLRPGNKISFTLPRIPTEEQQEKFVKLLMIHCNCWFHCYPKKIEELQKAGIKKSHLKVVETEI